MQRDYKNPIRTKKDFIGEPKSPKPIKKPSPQKSVSNSNRDPGLTYRPTPGSNSGGSGKGNSGENFPNSESNDQEILDPEFWGSVDTLGSSDAEENGTPKQAPKPSPPTGKLTKKAISENDRTTKMIAPFEFTDWEGDRIRIKSKELKKSVFAKGYEAGVVPPENLVDCPIQDDPTKYQRTDCGLVTDQSVEGMRDKLVGLATEPKKGKVKFGGDMPFYDTQKSIGYMDMETGDCGFYHDGGVDGSDFWTYVKYDSEAALEILANADWVRPAKPTDSNPDL